MSSQHVSIDERRIEESLLHKASASRFGSAARTC